MTTTLDTTPNAPADTPASRPPQSEATTGPARKPRRRSTRRDGKAEMAKPEELRSGRFRGYVWDPDLQEKVWAENSDGSKTFATASECRAAQRHLAGQLEELYKASGSPLVRQRHRHNFADVVAEFLPLQGGTRSSKETRRTNCNRLMRRFGDLDIAVIQEEDYLAYMRECEDANMAPATAEMSLITMRQIMVFARKQKYIEESPVEDIPLPKVHRVKEPRVLDDQDFLFLLNFVPLRFVAAMLLGYDEGLRAGEVCGLRWKRLDLDSEQPKVLVQDVVEKAVKGQPKRLREHTKGGGNSNGGEYITLTPRSVEALLLLRDMTPDWKPDDLVFPNARGTLLSPEQPSAIMKKAWMASGLSGDRATFHGLRHSCATNLARAGVKADIIMQRMRHKTFDVTLQYIKAASLEAQDEAVSMVEEMHQARVDMSRRRRQELAAAGRVEKPRADEEGVWLPKADVIFLRNMIRATRQMPGMEKFGEDLSFAA